MPELFKVPTSELDKRHEPDGVHAGGVGYFIISFVLSMGVLLTLVWLVLGLLIHLVGIPQKTAPDRLSSQQPLQPSISDNHLPWQDLAAIRAAGNAALHPSTQPAASAGFVKIPIEQAMKLIVQRGSTPSPHPTTQPWKIEQRPPTVENRT